MFSKVPAVAKPEEIQPVAAKITPPKTEDRFTKGIDLFDMLPCIIYCHMCFMLSELSSC